MPLFGQDPSKTEAPTPKRRGEARGRGQVARSKEISNVVVLFAALVALAWYGTDLVDGMGDFMAHTFGRLHELDFTVQGLLAYALFVARFVAKLILPILLILLVAGVLSNIAQVGWIFTTEPLQPDLAKLNPINGLRRIVSLNGIFELFKSSLKLIVVGGVAYYVVKKEMLTLPFIGDMSLPDMFGEILRVATKLFLTVGVVMIIIAIIDYAYTKWEYEQSLKMSKEEVKDEAKQREGDPQIKAKQRQKQREVSMRRMMQEVPRADVVITNPTFIAVAIRYAPEDMQAPTVVAKGARLVAERIRDLAKAHGVLIHEDPPLAQSLYDMVEIGQQIPPELFGAVAQVLAYVYRMKGKAAA
ncbi:MAG: flagellar biosynthesis protein FlhB [Nitrospirae bacterium]|nr:flagellar biosynthesis protein FlhB [Nitrospirota bacterium]